MNKSGPTTSMDPAESLYLAEMARYNAINETIAVGDTPVQRFYEDAVVLITGASGFLGKQLTEKLLRSCKIQKIYLLLRPKEQKSLEERVNDIVKDELYDYLRETQPRFKDRLIPIAGDITENRLKLSEENWTILTEEVNVIFHVAATVNFLETLTVATLTNVRGTREMLKLAKACKQLKSFVHVSTAYAHATSDRVKQSVLDDFYDSPISPQLLIDLVEQLDENKLNDITPRLLDKWPNTYAFTKAVAEELVRTMGTDLPICIVRPAIVMQAYLELPGWADRATMNNNVIGFIVGLCLGGLHVIYSRAGSKLDFVPVDIVNNTTIVAAQEAAKMRARSDQDIKIYVISRVRTPLALGKLISILKSDRMARFVTPKIIWYPYAIHTDNIIVFSVLSWLLHLIPGYLVDEVLKLTGKKAKVVKLLDRAFTQSKVYAFYLCNEWKFEDSNLLKLSQTLSPADKIIFNCDFGSVDSMQNILNSVLGSRKFIFRDGLQNSEYAYKKMFWFRILNVIFLTVYGYLIWKVIYLVYLVFRLVFNF